MKKPDSELLRDIRQALNLTTAELAAEISTPAPLLEVWEQGKTAPRAGLWRAIVELIARRGVITLESEAEAAERRHRDREQMRAAEIKRQAEGLQKPQRKR